MALSAGAVIASCGRKPGSGYAGYALVATSGEQAVSVVDLEQFRLLSPIALGAAPTRVVTGASGRAYILTASDRRVYEVDARRRLARSCVCGPGLVDLRMTADEKHLVGLSQAQAEVVTIDVSRMKVSGRFGLSAPSGQMASVNSRWLATSARGAGLVEMIDLHTGQHWQRRFGGAVGSLQFRQDGGLLLVANLAGQSITALSVPALEIVADLPLAMQPDNLCSNQDGGQVFVTGKGMDGVAIIFPYRILQVDQTVLAGRDPGLMVAAGNPELLFVGSASGSDVCILSIGSRKVVGLVDVGRRPSFLTVTPDNQYALVLDREADSLALIRIPAIRLNPAVVRSKSGASLFTVLSVGREPVNAAVVPYRA